MINPLPGYAIIEPIEEEMKTTSGLVIPDSAKDRPVKGRVLATGPHYLHVSGQMVSPPVEPGSIVYHKKWGGEEIKQGEKKYRVVRFEDICAVEV